MVNLKIFTTGEYDGLPKCIIAHNLDEEIHFHVKEKQILLAYHFLRKSCFYQVKIVAYRGHMAYNIFLYIILVTLKPIAINLLFLHSYVTGSLYLYMQVRIYGLRHSLWVKNMVFSNKVKENSLLKFLKFQFITYHFQ